MNSPLLAAGWDSFAIIVPIVVAILVWAINQFAGKIQPPPAKRPMPPKPLPGTQPPQPGQQSLRSEIDNFLREAQAKREGRPVSQQPTTEATPPMTAAQRQASRPVRRSPDLAKRPPPREAPKPPPPLPPAEKPRERESVAQYVAEHIDSTAFAQRASSLSHLQEESDSEFQKHMQRVFEHDVGKMKSGALGVFEAAGASAAQASAAAATAATATAAGSESATAPMATRKTSSNIAVFLAARKNIRDAVILTEILQRPEHRW
jgi:hypothetical protein